MRRFFIILLIILIIEIGFIVFGFSFSFQKVYVREKKVPGAFLGNFDDESEREKFEESEITVFAVGDIMLNRGVEFKIKENGNGDYRWLFLKIADDLQKADILFGNLEGPISAKGERVGSIYSFRAEPQVIEGLSFAGFDILSLANNHMLDYQRVALEDTMNILKENGIDYVGAGFNSKEAFSVKIKTIGNTKIGFLALTDLGPEVWRAGENYSGIAWLNEENIEEIKEHIKTAKQKVDVLIVSFHSGEEYSREPTPSQVSFGRLFVDAGADLVIGHHSHVIQKIEKYKTGTIAYSLGNFVFDQGFSQETMEGLLLEIIIKENKIKEVNSINIKISNSFQPSIKK